MHRSPIRLVVLFGGRSAEHDISCISAAQLIGALDPDRYQVAPVAIGRDGRWMDAVGTTRLLATGGTGALPKALIASGPHITPEAVLGHTPNVAKRGSDPVRTVVFPVLHGPFGEDGTVQGMLELADLPYVGSGVLGSALAMDKAAAKTMIAAAGIPQARWRSAVTWELNPKALDDIAADLKWPMFVKPANMGSSIGVSRVEDGHELDVAVRQASRYDEILVFEEAVVGREIEIGIIGSAELRTSVPGEIVSGAAFYDYDDKYLNGAARWTIPANLPASVVSELGAMATNAFRALRAEILGRADFFYEPDGRGLLFNELNTMPGLTPMSMFPLMWAESGIPLPKLLANLIDLALERHDRRIAFRSPKADRN